MANDDLSNSLEKFVNIEDYKRQNGQLIQLISEYISVCDSKYRKIEKRNRALLPEILAFKLLRKAKISKEENILVLTSMNYEKKDKHYEEEKRSLKKFKGNAYEGTLSGSVVSGIKLEPAFLAENEEALLQLVSCVRSVVETMAVEVGGDKGNVCVVSLVISEQKLVVVFFWTGEDESHWCYW